MTAPASHSDRRPILGAMAALAGALGACSWTEGPIRRHLILGLGVVDVAGAPSPAEVKALTRAEHCRATGLLLASGPVHTGLLVGFAERTTLEASPHASVVLRAGRADSGVPFLSITPIPSIPSPKEISPCAPSPP